MTCRFQPKAIFGNLAHAFTDFSLELFSVNPLPLLSLARALGTFSGPAPLNSDFRLLTDFSLGLFSVKRPDDVYDFGACLLTQP